MSVKLFVSDIDGTLVISGKNVSEKNIVAVKKMVDAGIIVTIATGRMYRTSLHVAEELQVNVPIITYNGALIKSVSGEIFHEQCLSPEIVVELANFFEENNLYVQSFSEDILRFPFRCEHSNTYESLMKISGEAVGWDGLRKFTSHVYKFLSISDTAEEADKVIAMLKNKFGEKINVMKSTPTLVEIVCPGVSKAAAVKILAEKFGVDISEVMAIGDSENDLPMLLAAGKGIAMGNAVDAVKNSCDFQTGLCENDGFAEAVEKFVFGAIK